MQLHIKPKNGGQNIVPYTKAAEVKLIVSPVNHVTEAARIRREMEKLEWTEPCVAGYKLDGTFTTCKQPSWCRNTIMAGSEHVPDFVCAAQCYCELEAHMDERVDRQAILDFYWRSKGTTDAESFLRRSGFIKQYEYGTI
jgi:hypothetical protein